MGLLEDSKGGFFKKSQLQCTNKVPMDPLIRVEIEDKPLTAVVLGGTEGLRQVCMHTIFGFDDVDAGWNKGRSRKHPDHPIRLLDPFPGDFCGSGVDGGTTTGSIPDVLADCVILVRDLDRVWDKQSAVASCMLASSVANQCRCRSIVVLSVWNGGGGTDSGRSAWSVNRDQSARIIEELLVYEGVAASKIFQCYWDLDACAAKIDGSYVLPDGANLAKHLCEQLSKAIGKEAVQILALASNNTQIRSAAAKMSSVNHTDARNRNPKRKPLTLFFQSLDFFLWMAHTVEISTYLALAFALSIILPPRVVFLNLLLCFLGGWLIAVFCIETIKRQGSSPRPEHLKIGGFRKFCMLLKNYWVLILLYYLLQPFNRLISPCLEWVVLFLHGIRGAVGKRRAQDMYPHPVLLIHGFACNAIFWMPVRFYLAWKGVRWVHSVTLNPWMGDIDAYAEDIAEKVLITEKPFLILVGKGVDVIKREMIGWKEKNCFSRAEFVECINPDYPS
ncbi:hypothetical protein BSKO_13543 [Bryopsis sp. KO-2023]|nr:hypothetical protein BSKO_13543 [Bryopsis sp. KO-2023]